MSNFFNNYALFKNIEEEVKHKIKRFYIFDDSYGDNVLYITTADQVFGFGLNYFGCCGLGHNRSVTVPEKIPELCGKNIHQFFNGNGFVLALSSDKCLYGWGRNNRGQLGRGYTGEGTDLLKPKKISFSDLFVQISCGSDHTLALALDGKVYGWGDNELGQFGFTNEEKIRFSKPTKISIEFNNEIIKSVHCSYKTSLVLTQSKNVYFININSRWNDENILKPRKVNLFDIKCVCPTNNNTYFLSEEGFLYFIDEDNLLGILTIDSENETNKLSCLHSIPYYQNTIAITSVLSGDTIYYIDFDRLIKREDKTFCEFYSKEYNMTFKTIYLKVDFDGNNFSDQIYYNNYIRCTNRMDYEFEVIREMGSGAFGTVYKVKQNFTKKEFAIKKIILEYNDTYRENVLQEVNILSKCKSDYVVKYKASWIEDNCLYIQMEFCSDNLRNVIKRKPTFFHREEENSMNFTEYFISVELFKELLECVHYLHQLKPPIMHRDINPGKILIVEIPKNGRYLKLCDFGLAKFGGISLRTHTKNMGTFGYIAPEGSQIGKYNLAADIYSVGVISRGLFSIDDIFNPGNVINNKMLTNKWKKVIKAIKLMLNSDYRERPSSFNLLQLFGNFSITEMESKTINVFKHNISNSKEFFQMFLNKKLLNFK